MDSMPRFLKGSSGSPFPSLFKKLYQHLAVTAIDESSVFELASRGGLACAYGAAYANHAPGTSINRMDGVST